MFASLLRMTTKYGFNDVRDQLLKDLRGAYPTRWEDFKAAKVLGEAIFGSPKPHANAVLNLFEAQNVKFAIPFAAYRASIGGFSALTSTQPGAVLPRPTLATTIHGMHVMRSMACRAARVIAYTGHLPVCSDKVCILKVGTNPTKKRMEALGKIYDSIIDEREGGMLTPPSLGRLLCAECTNIVEAVYVPWVRSCCWKELVSVFGVSNGWGDV